MLSLCSIGTARWQTACQGRKRNLLVRFSAGLCARQRDMAKPPVDASSRWVIDAETAMLLFHAVQCLFLQSCSCDKFVMQGAGGLYMLGWYQHSSGHFQQMQRSGWPGS